MDLGGSSSDDGLAQTHRALQDGWQPRQATDGVRVLALDGGGTRGLITIEMLKALEETTGRRVHELFDVIGGTSTGGIIALALQEGFPLARIEELYRQLSVSVFKQTPRHVAASNLLMTGAIHKAAALEAILHDLFHEAAPEAEEQAAETACPTSDDGSEAAEAAEAARAASPPDTPAAARLERPRLLWRKAAAAFREARSRRRPERGPAEGASMLYRRAEQERRYSERIQVARCGAGEADSPARPPNVFVVACAVSQLPPSLFLFRNYELPAAAAAARSAAPPIPGSSSLSQAEAGRATSAAPSFFPPASFLSPSGGAPAVYQDGGLLANNPAALALAEAKALYPGAKIACVASFGTGAFEPRPVAKPTSFAHALSTLAGAATRTEEVHSLLCGVFGEGGGEAGATHYYRFNPPVPTAKQGRMDDTSPQVLLQYQALGRAYVSDGLGAADMAALAQRLAAASPAAPRPPGAWLAPAWWGATARDMMRQWLARRPRPLASFGRRSRL